MGAVTCKCGNLAILPAATCEACRLQAENSALRERCERADREFAAIDQALHSSDDNAMRLAKIAIAWSRYESPKHDAKD